MTEILNYISAWVTLLAATLALCVFFFEHASKKNAVSPGLQIKKSWLPGTLNKKINFPPSTLDGWLKKTLFPLRTIEIW